MSGELGFKASPGLCLLDGDAVQDVRDDWLGQRLVVERGGRVDQNNTQDSGSTGAAECPQLPGYLECEGSAK